MVDDIEIGIFPVCWKQDFMCWLDMLHVLRIQ
jgi:hypothetical protein